MLLMSVICGAMAQNDAMYIYRNDGEFNAFLKTDVDSMRYSHIDADGVYHNEWQMQEIFTPDSTYLIPLAAIDSISFVTPHVEYQPDVLSAEEEILNYVVSYTDNTLTLKQNTPKYLVPKIGEVFVCEQYEDPLPDGFFGRCVSMTETSGGIEYTFEEVGLNDIYSHLVVVGKGESYNEDDEVESNQRRTFTTKKNKKVKLPSKLSLDIAFKDLFRREGDFDGGISGVLNNPKLTMDYIICLGEKNLKNTIKLVAKLTTEGELSVNGKLNGSFSPDPYIILPVPIKLYGLTGELDFGVFFEASGEINANYTVPFRMRSTKGFHWIEGQGMKDLSEEKGKDYFEKGEPAWDININGSIYCGAAAILSVGLVDKKCASLDVTFKFGPELSANFQIGKNEAGEGWKWNTGMYEALKNTEITTSLKLTVDPGYKVWFSERQSMGVSASFIFKEETHPLLPSFTDLNWKAQGSTSGTLTANVSDDIFVPVKLGWTLMDEHDAIYDKYYYTGNYKKYEDWNYPSMTHTLSNLPSHYNYKAYPTIKLWKWEIPINEYVEVKKKDCTAHITDFKQTGSNYSQGGYNNDGRTYDYKYEVATTVEIESLDGISEWGYAYKDPYGNVKHIPLTEYGTSHTDTRYAYYRNEAKSTVCLFGYVKYVGDDKYYYDWSHDYPLEYEVNLCPDNNHPHAIDLGLPSGTKWCCMNVGASSPEQYGGYYAWGETSEKSVYNDVTYSYASGVDSNSDGWYDGTYSIDWFCQDIGIDIADTFYDVAHVRMGGSWRMPKPAQLQELKNNCTYIWAQQNGMNGILVTGKNGNQLFLPAAGRNGRPGVHDVGDNGFYWLSTKEFVENANILYFSRYQFGRSSNSRSFGCSVRAVCP